MKRSALVVMGLVAVLVAPCLADEAKIPLSYANAAEIRALFGPDAPKTADGPVTLPEGVEEIEAIMQENAIRAVGTEAGIAELREMLAVLDRPRPQVKVAMKLIDVHDGDVIRAGAISAELGKPTLVLLTRMADEEIAGLTDAGTVINEPRITLASGRVGTWAFESEEGDARVAATAIALLAQVLADDAISLQLDLLYYDHRPQADQEDVSLQALVRVGEGETIGIAPVGADGQIVNPIWLLTARIVR